MFLANCFPLLCKMVVLVLHWRSLEIISFVLSASASHGPTAPRSPSSPSILILVRLLERIFFLISAILLMSSLSESGFNWSAIDWSPAWCAPYFMASWSLIF